DPCAAGTCSHLYGWRIANGKFVALLAGGIRVEEGGAAGGAPLNPLFLALDQAARYLYMTGHGFVQLPGVPPGTEFRAIARNADGSLGAVSPRVRDLCLAHDAGLTATANGTRSFVYNTCGPDHVVQWTVIDNTSGNVISSGQANNPGSPLGLTIDPGGRYLLVTDVGTNSVEVYTIDQTIGAITQTQQVAAGTSPSSVTFDSTGNYVYVSNGGCLVGLKPGGAYVGELTCAPGSNNISAYRFSNGSLQPLGTYPAGQGPVSIAVVKP